MRFSGYRNLELESSGQHQEAEPRGAFRADGVRGRRRRPRGDCTAGKGVVVVVVFCSPQPVEIAESQVFLVYCGLHIMKPF